MKYFFGVNIDEADNNASYDGEVFQTRTLSQDSEDKLKFMHDEYSSFSKQASLPRGLIVIAKTSIYIAMMMIAVGIIELFSKKVSTALLIIGLSLIFWAIYFGIAHYAKIRAGNVAASEDFSQHVQDAANAVSIAMEELGIPEDSKNIDCLACQYKIVKGQFRPQLMGFISHINLNLSAYIDHNTLCLSDLHTVWEIPLSNIISVKKSTRKTSAVLPEWNKEEPVNSEKYKKYKIRQGSEGHIICWYSSALIRSVHGEFELFIPDYDVDEFCALTGVSIEE